MESDRKTNVTGTLNKMLYEGKTFGNLRVINYINAREVVCQCNCENHTIVTTRKYRLDEGSINDCGCSSEHTINKKKYENIVTNEYTILEYVNAVNIMCKCSCGKIFSTTKQHIDNNEIHSCGCRHHIINYNKQYSSDTKGYLSIIKHIGYGIYKCKCTCGNTCYRSKQQLDSIDKPSCGCKKHMEKGITSNHIALMERIYNYVINNKNKTIQEIADELSVSYSTIQKAVHRLNIEENVTYNDNVSHGEKELRKFIRDELKVNIIENSKSIITPLELDIYIPDKKLAIEFNGNYWHSDEYIDKNYHRDKTLNCAQESIRLIHVFEYEWTNEIKKEIIKNIVRKAIVDDCNKIYAKNTQIKEIESNICKDFCDKYHLQGYTNASVSLGCFYENNLIGIMTFGKPRFNSNYEYELIRLCWINNVDTIGGSEKLFAYFINKYNPESIVTYCNISKFNGSVYKRIGFDIVEITEPSYVWTKNKFNITYSRYQAQKHKLIEAGLGKESQTEEEIMNSMGYVRVYDCGSIKFEWRNIK